MIASAHADHNPNDFAFQRTQSRYSGTLEKSPPPIRTGILHLALYAVAVVAAVGAAVVAWANRPYPRWRSF